MSNLVVTVVADQHLGILSIITTLVAYIRELGHIFKLIEICLRFSLDPDPLDYLVL